MTAGAGRGRRRVAVVTGGGRGIGAAIAEELARTGAIVVTVDPLVALDGSIDPTASSEPTTADRIVAAGGVARSSSASVTDEAAVDELFAGLVAEFGGLDAVVNVAGITRPTGFATGTEDDWRDVLSVHVDGYRNVLRSALVRMEDAGHGRILGVTSGAGWRPADAGAYGCAKRAVASLTWQLGRVAPPGVVVNALSPIALTRMVTAAMARRRDPGSTRTGSSSSGGLALGTGMPSPGEVAPLGAYLVGPELSWCTGQVVFAGGSELAVVDPPRLLEVVRADGAGATGAVLDAVGPALVGGHERQASTGGANPRFAGLFERPDAAPVTTGGHCGILVGDTGLAAAVATALEDRGARATRLDPADVGPGFDGAAAALVALEGRGGPLDALVVGLDGATAATRGPEWRRVLDEHAGTAGWILADAARSRAVADHARRTGRALRLVTMVDATTTGGRTRAHAAAQLARAALSATDGLVTACTVGVEASGRADIAGQVAAYLAVHPDAAGLSGAELVTGDGWFGLRSHPRVGTSIVHGGPGIPEWLDAALRSAVVGNAPAGTR